MSKRVELPLVEPLYSTYHYQGPCTAIAVNNPTIRNWYLNERMNLTCTRKFLNGFTTPEISVTGTSWSDCPYIERSGFSSRFAKGHINRIIRRMLDEGYYVAFNNVDDYYVEGKSWYRERHFNHDGMICGYDQNDKTYCVYSYDSKWIYRKFWTSQRSFNNARVTAERQGCFSNFYALKVKGNVVDFSPQAVYARLKEYLDSDVIKYTELVKDADMMRMLYASHHMKRRDSVLPVIQKMLLKLMQEERKLLGQLIKKMERKFENEVVEVSEK